MNLRQLLPLDGHLELPNYCRREPVTALSALSDLLRCLTTYEFDSAPVKSTSTSAKLSFCLTFLITTGAVAVVEAVDLRVRPLSFETTTRGSSPDLLDVPPVVIFTAWLRMGFRGIGTGILGYGRGGMTDAGAFAFAFHSGKLQFRTCSSPRRCVASLPCRTKHPHGSHLTMS